MKPGTTASRKRIWIGLLALSIALPLAYAQRQGQGGAGAENPRVTQPAREAPHEAPRQAPRETPRPTPQPKQPVIVNRTNHGSIRHMDTHTAPQRPVEAPRGGEAPHGNQAPRGGYQHQHVAPNHDVEADAGRRHFWNDFRFGARHRGLRPGFVQLYVGGIPFFYDDGIYYQQAGDEYQEVYPPVGADVQGLPDGAIEIDAGNIAYYYAGGAFYVQQDSGYVIAPPPMGVAVPELPPGAVQVSYNGGVAYQFNGVYYQPEFVDGVTQYVTFQP